MIGKKAPLRWFCVSTSVKMGFGVLVSAMMVMVLVPCVECVCQKLPVIFNFGDSNSDTGGSTAGLGYIYGLPEGRAFFKRGTGRLSDGRLVIDFLCESVNSSYLTPYLESVGPNFTHGANFAISGSSVLPRERPFSLNIQTLQFVRFKSRSLELVPLGTRDLVNQEGFQRAVYVIDIGQNDISGNFNLNMSYQRVLEQIPSFISEIKGSMQNIHGNGGRNFWIHNTGPLGCLPEKLSRFNKDGSDLDEAGCLTTFNNAAKAFNAELDALCNNLRSELSDATIVYNDIYSIKYDIIANYTKYGFDSALMACCGYGGPPYNFNVSVQCLGKGFEVCDERSRRVSWDGVHYSEAANSIVASKLLSGDYSTPRIKFDSFCSNS